MHRRLLEDVERLARLEENFQCQRHSNRMAVVLGALHVPVCYDPMLCSIACTCVDIQNTPEPHSLMAVDTSAFVVYLSELYIALGFA